MLQGAQPPEVHIAVQVRTLEQEYITLADMNPHAFGDVVEPYRFELQAHCYRLLGTIQDAEDMVQETFLRAWNRRVTYTEDVSVRAWLYRIATNICLDTLKKHRRRAIPATFQAVSSAEEPIPTAIMEPVWLDPYPDELLVWGGEQPEQAVLRLESVQLALLAALQHLPPRQRAVLLLSDVFDGRLSEIAGMLNTTVSAVKSALHRARTTLAEDYSSRRVEDYSAQSADADMKAQLGKYVLAWENADVDALINLLRDDATFSMPPIPSWYQGKDSIGRLVSNTVFAGAARGRWRLQPTRANGQPAFGLYRRSETGAYAAYGIQVVTAHGGLIDDIITFRNADLAARFNLPAHL